MEVIARIAADVAAEVRRVSARHAYLRRVDEWAHDNRVELAVGTAVVVVGVVLTLLAGGL